MEQLTAEKNAFDADVNSIPSSLGKTGILIAKRINNAHSELASAYKRAANLYKDEGNDGAAQAVKLEQEKFLTSTMPYRRAAERCSNLPTVLHRPPRH